MKRMMERVRLDTVSTTCRFERSGGGYGELDHGFAVSSS